MCFIKITCPLNNEIAPLPFAPTIRKDQFSLTNDGWLTNFHKHSDPYRYNKFDFKENSYGDSTWESHWESQYNTQNTPYQRKTNHSAVLLFDSEEELNAWSNNCRLTDPQLIADQEMWNTAHGITFTYEFYSLSPTIGPYPIM